MEDNKQFDLDISTDEGRLIVKEKIYDSLKRFNDDDKKFLGDLLFVLLSSVGDQQLYNDHIFGQLNNIGKILNENGETE